MSGPAGFTVFKGNTEEDLPATIRPIVDFPGDHPRGVAINFTTPKGHYYEILLTVADLKALAEMVPAQDAGRCGREFCYQHHHGDQGVTITRRWK